MPSRKLLTSPHTRRPKRECAYTSYKQNSLNPVWSGERLQVGLMPGGTRPVRLLIEIWDKDIQTADDIIARAELVLDDPKSGTVTMPLFAVEEGAEDVEAFTFSYEFQVEDRVARVGRPPPLPAVWLQFFHQLLPRRHALLRRVLPLLWR